MGRTVLGGGFGWQGCQMLKMDRKTGCCSVSITSHCNLLRNQEKTRNFQKMVVSNFFLPFDVILDLTREGFTLPDFQYFSWNCNSSDRLHAKSVVG